VRAHLRLIGALAAAAVITGCAAPSQPGAMIAAPAGVHHSRESVSVQVSGGKETSSVRTSQISDKDFAQALRESIEKAGLFAQTAEAPRGTYRLEAYIGELTQPFIGFDMTVTMEVTYTLTDTRSQQVVLKKPISATHTATTGDSVIGVKRLQLANEAAARKNIEQAITEMSKLELD